MRSVQLQSSLTELVEAVSVLLSGELAAGAEIPFELERQPSGRGASGPSLYCYRPLTVEFLAERRGAIEALPAFEEAARLLASFDGLDRYLINVGEEITRLSRAARVRVAVGSLLGDVFAEQSDFELRPERVSSALARLESTAMASTSEVTLVATLHGLTITSPELQLTGGLTIARPGALEGLPAGALHAEEQGAEHLVVVLAGADADPRQALARGPEVLRDLLRALRLFGDGRVTLGPLGWTRIGGGQWSAVALGSGGHPHGMLVVTADQEDELRAFCNLVSRRAPKGDELAWALRRFELGCAREDPFEALSDNLLALRALLEPEGAHSGMLAGRLAVLCATPERRADLAERTARTIALERAAIDGTIAAQSGAVGLARDLADNLRALLRDVVCGHLDPDLVGLADELLLSEPALAEAESALAADEPVPVELEPALAAAELEPVEVEPALAQDAPRFHETLPRSGEQLLADPGEPEEILDLFI
jgi:hypothetical protein